ncbi:MAG: hydroxyethylthiazole kinase [Mogibacterium sp.]|nr:hydroxyethylthiazole kinase [Mogibacterium sp.]
MTSNIPKIRETLRQTAPLIHCITNPISINQCANAILATGARPIMAEHPEEVAEITSTAASLMLNLGNITDVRMSSMRRAAAAAAAAEIPVTLDLCGISCSTMRREYTLRFLSDFPVTLLKGNYSEILSLEEASHRSSGVDAMEGLDTDTILHAAAVLARHYHCFVLASGKTDILSNGNKAILLENGTPQLASVTGTGCMLGALCASYLAAERTLEAVAAACLLLGIAGEEAETELGSGSFCIRLLDRLSTLGDDVLAQKMKWRICDEV